MWLVAQLMLLAGCLRSRQKKRCWHEMEACHPSLWRLKSNLVAQPLRSRDGT